jgi:hypothetical protein
MLLRRQDGVRGDEESGVGSGRGRGGGGDEARQQTQLVLLASAERHGRDAHRRILRKYNRSTQHTRDKTTTAERRGGEEEEEEEKATGREHE